MKKLTTITLFGLMLGSVVAQSQPRGSFWQPTPEQPYPPTPPMNVTQKMDRDQMLWQMGIEIPIENNNFEFFNEQYLPLLREKGSKVFFRPRQYANPLRAWTWGAGAGIDNRYNANLEGTANVAFDGSKFFTNYIQSWEPGGAYFTGEEFYPQLALSNIEGLTAADWAKRRTDILQEVYKIWGHIPVQANDLKITWVAGSATTGSTMIDGKEYLWREYYLTGHIDISSFAQVRNVPVISTIIRMPTSLPRNTKTPLVIANMGARIDVSLWEAMAPHGIAVMGFNSGALQPDNGAGLTSYLIGLVSKGNWRKPDEWGSIGAWSWGVSRIIDYFENHPMAGVDAKKICLTGHSRWGKATVVAMAYEPRLATAMPHSSGSLGVVNSRRHWGQDLVTSIPENEYHWLAGNFMRYSGVHPSSKDKYMPRMVMDMPVDGESLVMLCAPRPIFIGVGDFGGDSWADPYGHYLAAAAATPVYELLGCKGLVMEDTAQLNGKSVPMPVTDKLYMDGRIGLRRHSGGHTPQQNYKAFAEFISKYVK